MGRKPIKHKDTATAVIGIRVPGWLKNKIADHCESQKTSINNWAANVLHRALEAAEGLPAPPPAVEPVPTTRDYITAYLSGSPAIEPCGRPAPCERQEAGTIQVADVEYCAHCRIRIK